MLHKDFGSLRKWYDESRRDLPWRESLDPYSVMVSEFMLQQTTVAAVIPKYLAWLSRFPDVECLAKAELDEVFLHWSGLGYYQRARRLHAAAKLVNKLGAFPTTTGELQDLPGFGPYTAAAVSSICFGRPNLAIDTNVIRVLYRYYGIVSVAQKKSVHLNLQERMVSLLSLGEPGETNQALMELGATHCSVKGPDCLACPLRRGCRARTAEPGPGSYPLPATKKKVKKTPTLALVIEDAASSKVHLVKGTSLGLLRDLHQPPLLFGNEAQEHSISGAILELLAVCRSQKTREWTLTYGISGRRLEVKCVHWALGPKMLERVQSIFAERCLEYVLWSPTDESTAVSSLTRKVLSKWSESP